MTRTEFSERDGTPSSRHDKKVDAPQFSAAALLFASMIGVAEARGAAYSRRLTTLDGDC
jgi:hypothetical protein